MSQETRVLHVLAPGRDGGVERVVAMLTEGQRPRGVHVAAVLIPDEALHHPFVARLHELEVAVTPLIVGARDYVQEYRCLGALVRRLRPDVVHTHGYRSDVIAGAVARAHRIPTVSTVHGFTGSGRYARIYERFQCIALRRADAVIAVSRPLVDRLVRAGVPRARIHCVPNGFAPPEQILRRSAARKKLGIGDEAIVAAWVGRLSREKGADVMLDAIAECDGPWHFSMIGDGPERNRLSEQATKLGIADRVTWHGSVVNAGSLLTAFDAFVLSSRTEGTPIALFEAMHAGVPVVTTRVGGVPDVVGPAHALLVPPEQPGSIAQALGEITANQPAATLRCILARERLLHSFSFATWLTAIDAVYDGVLSHHRRAQAGMRGAATSEQKLIQKEVRRPGSPFTIDLQSRFPNCIE
jgi:glycosyltransferase involved in cell wall biosynthesis